jgi:KDO2-lipid IV(A) lauroyltransferase
MRNGMEACGAAVVCCFFRLLPIDAASGFGGWLGRAIGPRLGISRRARNNLRWAMPELDDAAIERIVIEMWDNLGRVVGEYPHFVRIAADESRVEILGADRIEPYRRDGVPSLLFSGHFANWELFPPTCRRAGMRCLQVYRTANNPLVDSLLLRLRGSDAADGLPKGPRGARGAIAALKEGRRVGMLIDQKLNDGIAVPFFGRAAMSPPAAVQLALRHRCALIPVRLERLEGCRFRLTFMAPLVLTETGDRRRDVVAGMISVNRQLEEWIRARPGQWLWLHRRWPDS